MVPILLHLLCLYEWTSLIEIHVCSFPYVWDTIIPSRACTYEKYGRACFLKNMGAYFLYAMHNPFLSLIFLVPFFKYTQVCVFQGMGVCSNLNSSFSALSFILTCLLLRCILIISAYALLSFKHGWKTLCFSWPFIGQWRLTIVRTLESLIMKNGFSMNIYVSYTTRPFTMPRCTKTNLFYTLIGLYAFLSILHFT